MNAGLASANESLYINLVRPSSTPNGAECVLEEPFNPKFTYPIFGEEETIIGYKDPKIHLNFRANDLKPSLKIEQKDKLPLDGIIPKDKQLDLETVFKDFLPACVFTLPSSTCIAPMLIRYSRFQFYRHLTRTSSRLRPYLEFVEAARQKSD